MIFLLSQSTRKCSTLIEFFSLLLLLTFLLLFLTYFLIPSYLFSFPSQISSTSFMCTLILMPQFTMFVHEQLFHYVYIVMKNNTREEKQFFFFGAVGGMIKYWEKKKISTDTASYHENFSLLFFLFILTWHEMAKALSAFRFAKSQISH